MVIARGDGTYNKLMKDTKKIQLFIMDIIGLTGVVLIWNCNMAWVAKYYDC